MNCTFEHRKYRRPAVLVVQQILFEFADKMLALKGYNVGKSSVIAIL
jgi:hypothetical protein